MGRIRGWNPCQKICSERRTTAMKAKKETVERSGRIMKRGKLKNLERTTNGGRPGGTHKVLPQFCVAPDEARRGSIRLATGELLKGRLERERKVEIQPTNHGAHRLRGKGTVQKAAEVDCHLVRTRILVQRGGQRPRPTNARRLGGRRTMRLVSRRSKRKCQSQ